MCQMNLFRHTLAAFGVFSLLSLPALSSAAMIDLTAILDGSQEVPANSSSGTGTGSMTFDDVTGLLSWEISFSGLSGPAQAAHFHGPAPVGSNAGVQVNIGEVSGTTSPMIGSATITSAQASDLLAGLWYINIHTTMYPGGEIRGQVNVVPLPAAAWLFLSGFAGLFGIAVNTSRRAPKA